jgi:predicted AlkP superfamily phosphohydrolase/phosphomutase
VQAAASDRTKVLYVALDACDAGLIVELTAAGHCPTFARLLAEGASVETVAPYGTFVGSTWMTIATGTEVSRHRYYNWVQVAEGCYDLRHTSPREAHGTPFWQTLSDAGRRLAVLDVPHAEVPASFNGAFLKEWGCHDRHHGTASSPPELRAELDALVGGHPYGTMAPPGEDDQFAPCDYTLRAGPVRTLDEERQIYGLIRRGIEAKRDASLHLLGQGGWDLFVSVIGESHCAGHQLWHVHDLDHPRHDPAARRLLGDPLVDVYSRLDAVVGEHLAAAGPDATCYVHLSHGMGPHYDGDHVLDEVLRRIDDADAATLPTGRRTRAAREALQRLPAPVAARLQPALAAALRHRIEAAPPVRTSAPGARPDRRWFQIPNNTVVGAVRFNVVGREPEGIVDAADVERLTEVITRGLLEVINVDTGRPVVQRVVPVDEVLDRFEGDAYPDLFVEWDRTTPIERVWSPTIGTVFTPYEHWRTGDHHDRGLLLATGAGIVPGRRARAMHLTEVAPTLAAALGDELPGIDGRPRLDLVGTPTPARVALATEAPSTPPPRPGWLARVASASNRRRTDPDARVAEGALELAQAAVARAEAAQAAQAALEQEVAALRLAAHDLERANLVWTTMRWLDQEDVDQDRLVTVITPTHERPEALAEAIRSVVAQRYQRWEMVVVDDGGDVAKTVVAEIGDERVRALRVPHGGPAAARNAGLDAATGSVITYLDDDNTFDPGWLKAVVWAFQHHPEAEVLYGARLIDDLERVHERGEGGWPWLQFNPFDFEQLEQGNLADMGVMAHVAGLPEARFDERLWEFADWDLLLALTEHRTPLELPAVALRYRTVGERLSGAHEGDRAVVLEKWRARRAARGG